ncbi:hypothetical protein ACQP25_06120 [Microtetraspora malaysiensis]|uniref:hypothetical protein n=1 Tax=Microtetraspora malaysiensis TaxID=161358 RepID=UPI003D8B5259
MRRLVGGLGMYGGATVRLTVAQGFELADRIGRRPVGNVREVSLAKGDGLPVNAGIRPGF